MKADVVMKGKPTSLLASLTLSVLLLFSVASAQQPSQSFFSLSRPSGSTTVTDTVGFSNLDAHRLTTYRKYQNIFEGDFQFNARNSLHFGYRYGHRRIGQSFEGHDLSSNGSVSGNTRSSESEENENNTHAVFSGFKTRPANNWTIHFDFERGTADNVFTRIGNYDYTNLRAKTRYAPTSKLSFNLAFISRDNANPSEIAGVSLEDFGASIKSRIFTSSLDWTPNSRFSLNTGYNYNWFNSNAVVNFFFNNIQHPQGRSFYYVLNNFFFIDTTALLTRRISLFTAYRINKDNGQGNRVADPIGTPGTGRLLSDEFSVTGGSCHKFPTANWKDVRQGDAAFPDVAEFPEHGTCLSCHRRQFFARQRPAPAICSNCHVKVTPQNTARHPFPSLGEVRDFVSDFRVKFPHEKHEDAECSDCHEKDPPERKPLKHALCFNCHNQESELAPLPPNCDSCHKQ